MTANQIRIPDDDFQAIKDALRANGYIPTGKLVTEFYGNMNKQLDGLQLGQIDGYCKEELSQLRLGTARMMGTLAGFTKPMIENEYRRYLG